MKQYFLLAFIFLGSIYISYTVGHESGLRQSHDATIDGASKVYMLTIAYSAALSLNAEMGNHAFIQSGNRAIAEEYSLKRIEIVIDQIEAIDYKNSPFETEINQKLVAAKEYVRNAHSKADDVSSKEN